MTEDLGRRAIRVLIPPAIVAIVAAIAIHLEPVRRFAVWALDPAPPPVAAETVPALTPTLDGPDAGRPAIPVTLQPLITGVPQPTDVASVPGHPDRAVVLSKVGTAYLAPLGGRAEPWFKVKVATTSELGLLGIAFHPQFATNGTFYVDATPSIGVSRWATRILRGHCDPVTLAHPVVDEVVLEVEQPYQNHNAGQIAFGPDGMLYVSFGDGGFRDDPHGNGQNLGVLLGKMLRIDVDHAKTYKVPPDNPFVGRADAKPEIWAYGLRNPWRFTFDPRGRMVVGDVGQNRFEEIDLVGRGDNLGWNVREGDHCFSPPEGCRTDGLVDPIWSYGRDEGLSVTGGVVWTAPGPLSGKYLFADYGTGRLWALDLPDQPQRVDHVTALGRFAIGPTAFARAPDGTVWITDFNQGAVYAIAVSGS